MYVQPIYLEIVVNEWIDVARVEFLKFFFDCFGEYELFIQNSSFDSHGYLHSMNRDWLLTSVVRGRLFRQHIAVHQVIVNFLETTRSGRFATCPIDGGEEAISKGT